MRAVEQGIPQFRQAALWCSCGQEEINSRGICTRCARRRKLSREAFGGCRERVLQRDGGYAQCCGVIDDLVVHHRRPGSNLERSMISLCRRCHARIHQTLRPSIGFPAELLPLWREVHGGLAEQLRLALSRSGFAGLEIAYQPALFDEPA